METISKLYRKVCLEVAAMVTMHVAELISVWEAGTWPCRGVVIHILSRLDDDGDEEYDHHLGPISRGLSHEGLGF